MHPEPERNDQHPAAASSSPDTPIQRELFSAAHYAALKTALLAAFDQNGFEQFWQFEYHLSLEQAVPVPHSNFTQIVDAAVAEALRRRHIPAQELVAAALRHNPTNPALLDLQARWANRHFSYVGSCPYPGMRPYTETQSALFFGRKAEVKELHLRVRTLPIVVLIGSSGGGKSSLLHAGLFPLLKGQGWQVRSLRPTAEPYANLHAALDDLIEWNPARLRQELSGPLLVAIDQYEELFTQGKADAARFQNDLLRLGTIADLHIVLTLRADYYDNLINTPLWERAKDGVVTIGPLTPEGLEKAIREPAEKAGVEVEPALVECLLNEAHGEPGALPFLQETLALLWTKLADPLLRLDDYKRLTEGREGIVTGLQVAMAVHADAVYANLKFPSATERTATEGTATEATATEATATESTATAEAAAKRMGEQRQALARRTLMRLVQFGEGRSDTRRQQSEAQLLAVGDDPTAVTDVINTLVAGRLLTASGAKDDRRYDISHEKLISGWPKLQEWIASLKLAEVTRRRLDEKAAEHKRLGPDGGLLDAMELREAQEYVQSENGHVLGIGEDLKDLIAASRKAINPGFNSRGVVTLAAILVSLVLWLGVVYLAALTLDPQVQIAIWISVVVALIALAAAAWFSARGRQHWPQHLTQRLGRSGRGLAVTGTLIAASFVGYAVVGVPLIRQIQYCQSPPRAFELPRRGVVNVALVNDNFSVFNADLIRSTLADQPRIRAWLATEDDVRQCGLFVQRVVHLRQSVTSAGEQNLAASIEGDADVYQPQVFSDTCSHAQQLAYMVMGVVDKASPIITDQESAAMAQDSGRCAAQLLNDRGVLALLNGDLDTAEKLLKEALEIAPDYDLAHKNLGDIILFRGDAAASLPHYTKAMELAPANPLYPFQLGYASHTLYMAGHNHEDFLRAESHYSKTLALDSTEVQAYSSLANLYLGDSVNLETAGDLLRTARSILNSTKRYSEVARMTYSTAVAKNLGLLALKQRDYTQAVEEFTLAATYGIRRFDKDIYGGLDTAYTALGETELACDARRTLAEVYRTNGEPLPDPLLDSLAACEP